MVDVLSVINLPETDGWESVPRLEDGWWPTGGAVNPPADGGLMNWQAQRLAGRTKFLRDQMDGAGLGVATVAAINNLDTLTKGGSYAYAAASTGAPLTTAGTVIHMAGTSAAEATQLATNLSGDRTFMRRRLASVWQSWVEFWTGGFQSIFDNSGFGFQRLPSGLILQWNQVGSRSNGQNVAFAMSFPVSCHALALSDGNGASSAGQAHILGWEALNLSGFNISVIRHDGDTGTASAISYIAIGR
jgi:hypothetical protein